MPSRTMIDRGGGGGALTEEEKRRRAQSQLDKATSARPGNSGDRYMLSSTATATPAASPPQEGSLTNAFTGKPFAAPAASTTAPMTGATAKTPTGIAAMPKGVTQGALDTIGVKTGAWYSANNMFYQAGDSKAHTMDEYRDITQPGWREASAQLAQNHAAAGRVLVDDGKGNRYYAAKDQAVQDAAGVWRPVGNQQSASTAAGQQFAGATGGTNTGAPTTFAPTGPTTGSTVQANGQVAIQDRPWSAETQAALDRFKAILNGTPITADDIMKSQEFTQQADAIRSLAELNSGIASANLRRGLSSRNMLRGTPAIQALAISEADFALRSQADQAAMIPTMLTAAYNRQQDQLKNYGDFLTTVSDLDNTSFEQGKSAFTLTAPYNHQTQAQLIAGEKTAFDRKQAADEQERADYFALTGQDIPVPARRLIDELLGLKRDSIGVADVDNQDRINRANQIRDELQRMGVNPDLFGGNVTPEQARQNLGTIGKPQVAPDPVKIITQLIDLKRGSVGVANVDNATRMAQADALRQQLSQFGIDPALFGSDVTLQQAEANLRNLVNPPKEVTQKDINALTIQELEIRGKRLDNEKKESDKEVKRLEAIAKADPTSPQGQLAVLEWRKAVLTNEKLEAEIKATDALREQRLREPEPKAPTVAQQRSALGGSIAADKAAGIGYEETVATLRELVGNLGDVSLSDALSLAAEIYGEKIPSATELQIESRNAFTADVLERQSQGLTYEDVVGELNRMVRAGTLPGLTHAQALDSIDRIYGKGRYEE